MAETTLSVIIKAKDDASKVLKSLSTSVNKAKKDIDALNKTAKTGNLAKETGDAAKNAERLAVAAKKAAVATARLNRRTAPLSANFAKATVSAETLAASISNSRGQLLATAAVATGLFLAIKKATDQFFKLEIAVAEVSTLVDTATISNERLTASVIELSNEFGVNAVEVAKATYQAISAGAKAGAEANELLAVALKTAIGGVTDVETAVDGLTTVINAFGFEVSDAARVSDILFTTMKNGKTTIEELSERFFQVAPVAAAMGVSFEDVNAALIALTLQGTPTRVAMTQIRAALTGFARDNPEVKKAFRDIGFESFTTAVAAQGLGKTFEDLNNLTQGNIGTLQRLTGSIEGVQAILGTTGEQARFFADGLEQINNSAGATDEAFEKLRDALGTQLNQALVQIVNAVRAFGEAAGPTFVILIQAVAGLSKAVVSFLQGLKNLGRADVIFGAIVTIVALTTATFTALVVVLGFAFIAFKELAPVVIFLNSGLTGTATSAGAATAGLGFLGSSALTVAAAVKVLSIALKALGLAFIIIAGGQFVIGSLIDIAEASDDAARAVDRLSVVLAGLGNLQTGVAPTDFLDILDDIDASNKAGLDKIKKGIEARRKEIQVQVDLLTKTLRLEDVKDNLNPGTGFEGEGFVGTIAAFIDNLLELKSVGEISLFQSEALDKLRNAENALKQIPILLAKVKRASKGFDDGSLDGLPRPFEEMENSIKAANKQFQALDDLKLSNLEKQLASVANQEISAARRDDDPLAEANIREKLFDDLTKLRETFSQREIDRQDNLIAALSLNIAQDTEDTVEQERKKEDRLNKLRVTRTALRLKQAKEEANSLIKESDRIAKAQENNSNKLKALAEEERRGLQGIADLEAEISDKQAVQRGRDESVVNTRRTREELRELRSIIDDIANSGGQITDQQSARADELISVLKDGALEATDLGTAAGRGLSTGIVQAIKDINAVRVTADRNPLLAVREDLDKEAENIKKQILEINKDLASIKVDIPIALALDDSGINDFQRQILEVAKDGEATLTLEPTINLDTFREELSNLGTEFKTLTEDFSESITITTASGGIFQQLIGADGEVISRTREGFEGIAAAVATLPENLRKVVEAVTNLNNDTFFSDTKTKLQAAFTDEELGTAFADGLSTGVEKTVNDLIEGIRKGLAELTSLAGFDISVSSPPGFATGGHVKGPGTSTSDSITARLSNNEFVMQARAVQKYGTGLFHQLNSLSFNALPKFAGGGLVQTRIPTPSTSSENSRDVVDLNFNIGGQKIQLQGRRDQVAALTRATRALQSTLIGG